MRSQGINYTLKNLKIQKLKWNLIHVVYELQKWRRWRKQGCEDHAHVCHMNLLKLGGDWVTRASREFIEQTWKCSVWSEKGGRKRNNHWKRNQEEKLKIIYLDIERKWRRFKYQERPKISRKEEKEISWKEDGSSQISINFGLKWNKSPIKQWEGNGAEREKE